MAVEQLKQENNNYMKALEAAEAKLKAEQQLTSKLKRDLEKVRKQALAVQKLALAAAPAQPEGQGVLRTQQEKVQVEVGSTGQTKQVAMEYIEAQQKTAGGRLIAKDEPERSHELSEQDACNDDKAFDEEFFPFVQMMVQHMAKKEVNTGLRALTETEFALGDGSTWQWSDDNGKALELLSLEAFDGHPEVRSLRREISEFIILNSPPPFIFRRRMAASLLVHNGTDDEEENIALETGGLKFFSDKKGARVKQAVKFHDFRNVAADIEHGNHHVSFNLPDGRQVDTTLGEETALSGGLRTDKGTASYVWFQDHGINHPDPPNQRIAKITLFAEQRSAEVFTRIETNVQSEDANTPLENVKVGYRFFAPDDKSVTYQMIHIGGPDDAKTCHDKACTDEAQTHENAQWVAISEKIKFGESHGSFVRLEHKDKFEQVKAEPDPENDQLIKEMTLWHNLGTIQPAQSDNFGLKLVVTAGHIWEGIHHYKEVINNLESSQFAGLDLSVSYDVGAEVNGVVSAMMQDCKDLEEGKLKWGEKNICDAKTREWIKAHVTTYLNKWIDPTMSNVFIRGASFVLMSCSKMLQLDQKYRTSADTATYSACVSTIAETVIPLKDDGAYWLDDLAAAVIGHAVAYQTFPHQLPGSRQQVNKIVADMIALNPVNHSASNFPNTPNGPDSTTDWAAHVGGGIVQDNMAWSFKAGLVSRACQMALNVPGLLEAKNVEKAVALVETTNAYMRACIDEEYPDAWQIKSSFPSSETNSETQAWTTLGLIPTCRLPSLRQV